MLTKYKDIRPKKDVKSLLKNGFHVCNVFRNFFRERAPSFEIFSCVVFSAELFLKQLENKKGSIEVRGHALREMYRKFIYCSGHFSTFLPLNLSVLPNMMHFVRTFSIIHACLGRKTYCYRKG